VITLKPGNKPIPASLAYDEPFGGSEQRNVEMMLRFLARDYPRNQVGAATISDRLRAIHRQLADRIARNESADDVIDLL